MSAVGAMLATLRATPRTAPNLNVGERAQRWRAAVPAVACPDPGEIHVRPRVCSAPVAVLTAVALAANASAERVQGGAGVQAASSAVVVTLIVGEGSASGFLAGSGLVVTSAHALGGRRVVGARLPAGSMVLGQVVWSSAESGLAVVRLPQGAEGVALDPPPPAGPPGRTQALVLFHSPTARTAVTQPVRLVGSGKADRPWVMRPQPGLGPEHLGAPVVDGAGRLLGVVARPGMGSAEAAEVLVVGASRVQAEVAHAEGERARAMAPAAGASPSPAGAGEPSAASSSSRARRQGASPDASADESDPERARREGAERFAQEVARLAPLRDSAGRAAARYAAECDGQYVPVQGSSSPNWPYPGGVIAKAELPECRTLGEQAAAERERLRRRLGTAEERARQAGVYPGTTRDILARHGFDPLDLKR